MPKTGNFTGGPLDKTFLLKRHSFGWGIQITLSHPAQTQTQLKMTQTETHNVMNAKSSKHVRSNSLSLLCWKETQRKQWKHLAKGPSQPLCELLSFCNFARILVKTLKN